MITAGICARDPSIIHAMIGLGKLVVYVFDEESSTYGVGNSSNVSLNNVFAISERAVDACSNFLITILDMTATISVCPCPPVRDFERVGWTRLVRYKEIFLIAYVQIGWRGGIGIIESRHISMHCFESRMVAYTAQLPVYFRYSRSQALQPSWVVIVQLVENVSPATDQLEIRAIPGALRKRYFLIDAGLWIVVAKVGKCDGPEFTTEIWIGSDELRVGVSYHLISPDREEHESGSGLCIEDRKEKKNYVGREDSPYIN
eukprot:1148802-Pelagomonas_calceolata.AAC.1